MRRTGEVVRWRWPEALDRDRKVLQRFGLGDIGCEYFAFARTLIPRKLNRQRFSRVSQKLGRSQACENLRGTT